MSACLILKIPMCSLFNQFPRVVVESEFAHRCTLYVTYCVSKYYNIFYSKIDRKLSVWSGYIVLMDELNKTGLYQTEWNH